MPYHDLAELPKRIKDSLPLEAQELYKKAHNRAWDEYKDPKKRSGQETLDEIADRIALAAVEKEYERDHRGNWHRKKK
jgi:cation transport regulator